MIKAVIFDLDGTVLNTLNDLKNAMNGMLRFFSFPEHSDTDFHRMGIGTGNRNYVKACLPAEVAADDAQVDQCLAKNREIYIAKINVETKPYPGIFDLFTYLVDHGIKINILSNKMNDLTQILVQAWFSDFPLSCVYGDREDVPRKPDPTSCFEIAEKLNLSPNEIAFIGDSGVDMKTGTNAGMVPIGVTWGYRDKEDLLASGAKFLAETPADIITIIKNYK